jgi:hypothetical protein
MQESPKKTRWYHYQPPLPAWFPGWLVACLVVGTTTFLAFWFGLNELSWKLFVLSFGLGFGMTLCILVLAFLKAKPEQQRSSLNPPIYVRLPVLAALVVAPGVNIVWREEITAGARRGDRVIAQGPVAVAIGFLLIAAPIPWNVWVLRRHPRPVPVCVGAVAALVVVAIGFGIALARMLGYC